MAVDTNGSLTTPSTLKADMDAPNGSIQGRRERTSRSKRKSKQSFVGWTVNKAAKLTVWYILITVFIRCPGTQQELKSDSPQVCKPYLQARDFITPHAKPYYDQYLAPYHKQAQPYIDQINEKVYTPGFAAYQQYGSPRVAHAQKLSREQWEKTIKPQLEVLQKESGKQYETLLAPHVKKVLDVAQPYYDQVSTSASDIWKLEIEPVYRKSKPIAEKLYTQGQEFAVNTALPHAQYIGNTAWTFWERQIWPKMRILYGENVEPQLLRITERLGRYKDGKKLEAEIKSVESSSKLARASSSISSLSSSLSSTIKEATADPSSAASVAASSPSSTPDPKLQFREDLKSWEHISTIAVEEGVEDLNERIKEITDTQSKSAGRLGGALVTQLEETVESTLNSVKARIIQIVGQVPEGADDGALEIANEDLVVGVRAAGQNVKARAQAVREWRESTQSHTQDLVEKALQSTLETVDSIRELRLSEIGRKYAASSLPHKEWSKYNDLKKAVQSWRKDVEKTVHKHSGIAAAKAASDDIEHQAMAIAEDAAKELGRLKEVGKWKIAANDASDDFATKFVPPPVRKAKEQIVEKVAEASQAVFGAEEAEPGSVESVTSIIVERVSQAASDASEVVIGSSTGSIESASSKIVEQASSISEKVIGSSTGSIESLSSEAAKSASSAASVASEAVIGTQSGISDTATDLVSSASSAILGTESGLSDSATDAASSISSAILGTESGISDTATDVASSISSAVLGSETPAIKKAASSISSQVSEGSKSASSILSAQKSKASEASSSGSSIVESVAGVSSPAASKISASISSGASVASSGASSVVSAVSDSLPDAEEVANAAQDAYDAAAEKPKKVFAGAMAQVLVEAREPILDDVVDAAGSYSESIQSMASVAGDKASELTQAVQDALRGATATQGSVESVTSLASAQYESAIAAASSVLFGTQKNVVEQGTDAAREQYLAAVTAASYAIYGTPVTAAPFAHASSAYNAAVSEAAKHFDAVKSRVSEQISGTPKPVHEQMLSSAESAYSAALTAAGERYSALTGATTQNAYDSVSSAAVSRLNDAVRVANEEYQSAKKAVGLEPTPVHQQYLASAQKAYYEALGVAHGRYSEFLDAASSIVAPTPTPTGISDRFESAMSDARAGYSGYMADASSRFSQLSSMASSAASAQGLKPTEPSIYEQVNAQLADAVSVANSKLAQASSDVSAAVYGTPAPVTESLASRASENWEALISRASEQVYGAPPPFTATVASYASQASEAAAAQWVAVNSLFSELINGKEPDFTESVYSRLQSAYATGAPALASQASSYASDAYIQAASAISAVFVPPTQVPTILEQVQSQLNAAVEAASVQAYGTTKGTFEQATEAAASAYSDAASQVSEAVYGTQTNYAEAAQASIIDIGASASSAISAAIYGSPTGSAEAASSAAASVYSSLSSQASEQAAAASSAVSSAIYGEEQTYLEGIQSQLSVAMASASSQISEFGVQASKAAGEAASTVSSVVSSVTDRVRDEL